MSNQFSKPYRYRPVRFFVSAYVFTWIFWIPAIFTPESISPFLMLLGLLAPAVVSTVFVMVSGSDALKQDLKNKIIGFYKVKWLNVLWAIIVFAIVIVLSILLSTLFGQSLDQFSFTEEKQIPANIFSSSLNFVPGNISSSKSTRPVLNLHT